MAKSRVKGNIKVGCIYMCDFGKFKCKNGSGVTADVTDSDVSDYNYRIPTEIVKKRPVVVIGKHRGLYLTVPISSKKEIHKKDHKTPENTGKHVKLEGNDFPVTSYYSSTKEQWAKSNLVSSVDGGRITDICDGDKYIDSFKVPDKTLKKIREGVIISIGMKDILI